MRLLTSKLKDGNLTLEVFYFAVQNFHFKNPVGKELIRVFSFLRLHAKNKSPESIKTKGF